MPFDSWPRVRPLRRPLCDAQPICVCTLSTLLLLFFYLFPPIDYRHCLAAPTSGAQRTVTLPPPRHLRHCRFQLPPPSRRPFPSESAYRERGRACLYARKTAMHAHGNTRTREDDDDMVCPCCPTAARERRAYTAAWARTAAGPTPSTRACTLMTNPGLRWQRRRKDTGSKGGRLFLRGT